MDTEAIGIMHVLTKTLMGSSVKMETNAENALDVARSLKYFHFVMKFINFNTIKLYCLISYFKLLTVKPNTTMFYDFFLIDFGKLILTMYVFYKK